MRTVHINIELKAESNEIIAVLAQAQVHFEQELLTLPGHLSSPRFLVGFVLLVL
jgi:hypothetical protein